MIIDTHSHVYDEKFDEDRDLSIERAIVAGVKHFVMPAVDSLTHERMFKVADDFKNHYPTIGVHPTSIKSDYLRELEIAENLLLQEKSRIVAIGEIGLDLYWDKTFIKEQEIALRRQFDWAIKYNLPAIVHTREAFPEMLNIVKDYEGSPLRIVFHGYSGTADEANEILSLGDHLLGIGGVVTFKKSDLYLTVKEVGLSKIVLETDAPYLPPVPYRGKRNESSYIPHIVSHISSFMECETAEIEEITTNNAKLLFKIG